MKNTSRALSITALALGLLSVAALVGFVVASAGAWPLVIGIVIGIAAVITGSVALKRRQPKGTAIAGIVLGGVVTVIALSVIVFALLFVGAL